MDASYPHPLYPVDQGATDHLIGVVKQAVQAQRIRQVLGGDPIGTATDNSALEAAAAFGAAATDISAFEAAAAFGAAATDNSAVETAAKTEFHRLYRDPGATGFHLDIAENYLNVPFNQSEDIDLDTALTVSSASSSSCGSMGQDMLPSIDEYLRKEHQTAAKSNFNFADAVVFREELEMLQQHANIPLLMQDMPIWWTLQRDTVKGMVMKLQYCLHWQKRFQSLPAIQVVNGGDMMY
jgi:hypothetical protein